MASPIMLSFGLRDQIDSTPNLKGREVLHSD